MEPDTPKPNDFAVELKRRREGAGVSQRRLSSLSTVSDSRIRQIEMGWQQTTDGIQPTVAKPDTIMKLARALRWDIDDALKHGGYDPRDYAAPEEFKDKPPRSLEELWGQMNDQQRKALYHIATLFVNPDAIVEPPHPAFGRPAFLPPAGKPWTATHVDR